MKLLDNLSLFLLIVEKGSLSAAGREAGLSPTSVSERLAALEAHYGVVLLNRTTRAISLTEEGRMLLDGARTLLSEVDDLRSRIRRGAESLSGPIRISAPSDIGRTLIAREVGDFLREHPAIMVELVLSDRYLDLVGEGIDLSVRFGTVTDSTLRIRGLGRRRRVLCASKEYVEHHGAPAMPADLRQHNCLIMRFGVNLDNVWQFGSGQQRQAVMVRGDRIASDGAVVRQWCLEGHGIMLKSELDVAEDIRAAKLVELLPEYARPPLPLQLMFPPSRAQPKRVHALAERLVAAFDRIAPLPLQRPGPEEN